MCTPGTHPPYQHWTIVSRNIRLRNNSARLWFSARAAAQPRRGVILGNFRTTLCTSYRFIGVSFFFFVLHFVFVYLLPCRCLLGSIAHGGSLQKRLFEPLDTRLFALWDLCSLSEWRLLWRTKWVIFNTLVRYSKSFLLFRLFRCSPSVSEVHRVVELRSRLLEGRVSIFKLLFLVRHVL